MNQAFVELPALWTFLVGYEVLISESWSRPVMEVNILQGKTSRVEKISSHSSWDINPNEITELETSPIMKASIAVFAALFARKTNNGMQMLCAIRRENFSELITRCVRAGAEKSCKTVGEDNWNRKNFSLPSSIVVVKSELKIKMKKMRYDEQQRWKQQKLPRYRLMVVERMIAYQGRVWVIVYVFRSYFASVGHWRTNQNNNFFITRRNYYQGAMGELPSWNRKFSSPKHIRENEFARLMLCMWCCAGAKKRSFSLFLSLLLLLDKTWVDVENFVGAFSSEFIFNF